MHVHTLMQTHYYQIYVYILNPNAIYCTVKQHHPWFLTFPAIILVCCCTNTINTVYVSTSVPIRHVVTETVLVKSAVVYLTVLWVHQY